MMVRKNAKTQQDQIEFAARYEELTKEYETQKTALEKAVKEKTTRQARQRRCERILRQ